jgi:tetratricopeptide (TPR) repeat protein
MNSGRRRPFRALAAVLLLCSAACLPLSGCSGPAPLPVPPAKESAGAWNRRGLAAEARGDRDGAIAAFGEALKVNRSIEDTDGAAVALINLARVHRLKGELPPAKEQIDDALLLVPPGSPLFPEAAFEKAKVALASGDLPAAREWAEKAVRADAGPARGRMLNLLARVDFLEGRMNEARSGAGTALEANRGSGARGEEANSLRLLGDVAAAGGERKGAEALYLEALAIDKEIAESRKIAADLRALGAAAAARGETERALVFYGRAAEVSRNGDDPKGAEAALLEISRLRGKAGPPGKD